MGRGGRASRGKDLVGLSTFKAIAADPGATPFDLQMLAFSAGRTADYDTAASAWERLVATKGGDPADELAGYADALYRSKRYPAVVAAVEPQLKNVKPSDWPKKLDPGAVGDLGLAYVKLGQLDKAAKVNENLLQWGVSGLDPAVIEFRSSLRLAEVERDNAASPNSAPALADYGRALLDLGRFEEAVAKLKQSLDVDASQVAVKRDLTWAMLQLKGATPATEDLASAVAAAKAGLNLDKGKQRSKDFFSWNQYAILLYALSEEQRAASNPEADATSDEAIDALREALSLGRVGAKRNAGAFSYTYGYMTGSEVAVSGFAYPQANSSFVLLDSLKRLRKDPNNYLALFNQASSLLDLGQSNLAAKALVRLATARPDYVEGTFLVALTRAKQGDTEGARAALETVVKANPRHPRANLLLADLDAKDGDVVSSAERLAAHARYYGPIEPHR